MGDYNINLLNFVTHKKTNDFIDIVTAQGFIPHNQINKDNIYIDHIYSNHIHPTYESGIIADHFGIYHLIYGTPPIQKIVYKQIR